MRHDKYILDDENQPVGVDLLDWARWFDANRERRIVARTNTKMFRVSTVFIGLDHNYDERGPPLLFETMVFDAGPPGPSSELDGSQVRYSTWSDAEAGHKAMVKRVEKAEADVALGLPKYERRS